MGLRGVDGCAVPAGGWEGGSGAVFLVVRSGLAYLLVVAFL